MKLISCYIRSFGTFKDASFDFSEGLNQLLCDNGIGKTTLISFIKAMFYGLDYKQGSNKFYERKHYLPWDNDECGGSLVFETKNKKYRIDRTFGNKLNEDTFGLYDEESLKNSDDYDKDIGEKLFGVDKESFEKSIFFGQGNLGTVLTTSLNAKIGNLTDVRDDMNRFDEAIDNIESARLALEKKSKTNPGKIPIIESEIKACENAAENIPVLENALKERQNSIKEKTANIEKISVLKNELTEKIKRAAERKEKAGALNAKKEHLEKLNSKISELESFFGGKIPNENEIDNMHENQRNLVAQESRLEEINGRLPKEDRIEFLTSVFGGESGATKELIDNSIELSSQIAKLRAAGEKSALPPESERDLEIAREFFKNKVPTNEEITNLLKISEHTTKVKAEIDALLRRKEEEERNLVEAGSNNGGVFFITLLVGILLIVVGFLAGILLPAGQITTTVMTAGMLLGGITIMLSVFIIYQTKSSAKKSLLSANTKIDEIKTQIETISNEISDKEEMCLGFINNFSEEYNEQGILSSLLDIQRRLIEYERLQQLFDATKKDTAKNADALAELTMGLYTKLEPYSIKYGYDLYVDNKESELLGRLSNDIKEYDEYLETVASSLEVLSEINSLKDVIDTFMNKYEWEDTAGTEQKLSYLKGMLENYTSTKNQINDLKAELEAETEELPDEGEESLEELQSQIEDANDKYDPLVSDRAKEEEELARIITNIEENEETARKLSSLKEECALLKEKVSVYNDTKKYLAQAKEEFLSVYMKPLRDGMSFYIEKFLPDNFKEEIDITLDMDLSIKLSRRGKIWEGDYLSEGYKDLASMCARFALINVLYKDEKPPIFMDDPFTNLDGEKIQKALRLLEDISADTQILYMTCHESRTLSGYKTFNS